MIFHIEEAIIYSGNVHTRNDKQRVDPRVEDTKNQKNITYLNSPKSD